MFNEKNITEHEFNKFSALIYEKAGINLHFGKKQLLQSRITKVLRKRNIPTFEDYYRIVLADKTNEEMVQLIDLISTNVTYFFREEQHFEFLKEVWYPENKNNQNIVRCWSSACSTGEEPYTISIVLNDLLGDPQKYEIMASDISTKVLSIAQKGAYSIDKVEAMAPSMLKKYFLKGNADAEGFVMVKKEYKDRVQFKRINLLDDFSLFGTFDFIFCRNVMIYFDLPTKEAIVNKMYNQLKKGGYLLIGHSESLNGMKHKYKFVMPAVYKKE